MINRTALVQRGGTVSEHAVGRQLRKPQRDLRGDVRARPGRRHHRCCSCSQVFRGAQQLLHHRDDGLRGEKGTDVGTIAERPAKLPQPWLSAA